MLNIQVLFAIFRVYVPVCERRFVQSSCRTILWFAHLLVITRDSFSRNDHRLSNLSDKPKLYGALPVLLYKAYAPRGYLALFYSETCKQAVTSS